MASLIAIALGFVSSRLGKLVSAIAAGAALIFGAIQYGKSQEREHSRVDDLEDYIETKKEIADVEATTDTDAARKRLRDNGWSR